MSVKSYAIGIDSIPLKFIKLNLPELLQTLTHILNHVIMTFYFPSLWKTGLVVLMTKAYFRSIIVLPVISKVIEKLPLDHYIILAVPLDFSKAFDSMLHALLLRKLKHNYKLSSVTCRLLAKVMKSLCKIFFLH
jgi:hypothetical protein